MDLVTVAPAAITSFTPGEGDLASLILIAEVNEFLKEILTTTSVAGFIAGDDGTMYLISCFRPSTLIMLTPEAFVTSHLS